MGISTKFTTSLLALTSVAAYAQPVDISMFPNAQRGFQRIIISVPARRDEANWKIEFYAGKVMTVDCNRHSMGANLQQHDLQGWGYNYWTIDPTVPVMSTRMGCPRGTTRQAFVNGQSITERYNSKLPLVFYVPSGFQVRYRLWSVAGGEMVAGQSPY